MEKRAKIWLIAAIVLILLGGSIFSGVMTVARWDFTKLSTNKYEINEHTISEPFTNISVTTDTADIVFLPAENAKVVCYEQKNAAHTVAVKDGTLTVELTDTRKWYEYIGINFGSPKLTVYLPASEYGDLFIRESTGDIAISHDFRFESMDITASTGRVNNRASVSGDLKINTGTGSISVASISAGNLELSVTTGKVTAEEISCAGDIKIRVSTGEVELEDVRCKSLFSSGNTGDISLEKVVAQEQFSIERTTGDVELEACDAAEIFIKTDTGDVEGSLLSDKVFIAQTDTGRVRVPKTTTGGKCEITTDTGDIEIGIN